MKTVIVPAPGKIEIRQVETPVINAYQALVKTEWWLCVMRPTVTGSRKVPRSRYVPVGFRT